MAQLPQPGDAPPLGLKSDERLKIKQLIQQLETDPRILPFKDPVDYQGLGLFDYPQIVKEPMDLSTIKSKLKRQKYGSIEEVFDDIQLIWNNCKSYNMAESEIYKIAQHFEKVSRKLVAKCRAEIAGGASSKQTKVAQKRSLKEQKFKRGDQSYQSEEDDIDALVTFNEKVRFSEDVRRLQEQHLKELVKLLKQQCPDAITETDTKLEITVDRIFRPQFTNIAKEVKSWINSK